MQNIDKDKFTELYEAAHGRLIDRAKSNMQVLLAMIVADTKIIDIRHAAYMLATVRRECANTWEPIEEFGKGKGKKYGRPDPMTGKVYYGRGYVQITWAEVYKRIGKAIGVDLYHDPQQALHYDVAYKIMSCGMRLGGFTGIGLNRYIHGDVCDYVSARKIINGTDCAEEIAKYAQSFEKILRASLT